MAEDEPWDQLMGGTAPTTGLKPRYGDDDRTMSETSSSGSSSHRMPSRWAQYERDDEQLRHESHEANVKAVSLAAEKIANSPPRDFLGGRTNVTSPMDYDSDEESVPNDAAIRAEALKMLELADDRYSVHKTTTGGFSASYSGGFSSSRRSSTGSANQKRTPSALAGLDFSKRANRASYTAGARSSYGVEDAPYSEEEGLVDVIELEGNAAPKKETKWSSRYSIDHTLLALSGGRSWNSSNPRDVLDQLERETDREIRSARNMFISSPHESTGIFGSSGFSFGSKINRDEAAAINRTTNLKSWRDSINGLDSNGKSLTPPEPRKTWQEQVERKKRQQRQLALVALGVCALILIVIGVTVGHRGRSTKSAFGASGVDRGTAKVVFYVTSDSPYDTAAEQKLTADLHALPEAEFIVHLGNIQDASVTLCSESRYARVKDVLLESPVPMFILPGEQDWNNCPNPDNAWEAWESNFGDFEANFDHSFMVNRQLRRKENFSFLHKDVLFMGFHLVGGRNNAEELDQRLKDDINWMESMVSMNQGDFKSIVMFGNARPGPQQRMFFQRLSDFLGGYDLPIIYVHANSGVGGVMQYDLFGGDEGIEALQIEDGGQNPPMKIAVYEGDSPFVVG